VLMCDFSEFWSEFMAEFDTMYIYAIRMQNKEPTRTWTNVQNFIAFLDKICFFLDIFKFPVSSGFV